MSEMQIKFPAVLSAKIGKLKIFQLQLHIDHSVKPVAQNYRPVPFNQRDALENELNKRLEQDIIETVFGLPTDWISQLVLFFKPNSPDLRITVDYREVNKAVKRERHLLPTLEEIVILVQDATIFDF